MKILVYGAGVLGGNFARNLFRSGKDVTLLARGEWGERLRRDGLCIRSYFSPFVKRTRIPVVSELKQDDVYDIIFVFLRYSQLPSVLEVLRQNPSPNVVFVGNNVNADKLRAQLPQKNVMFAFAQSAGHREKDKIVSVDLKKITIGQLKDSPSNEALIQKLFEGTGYKVVYEPNMGDYLLCHAAFVMPIAFACYRADGELRRLRRDKAYINRIIDANIEGYRAIEEAGHEILPQADKEYAGEKYRKTCYSFFRLIFSTKLGKICASDHAMNAVDEMRELNRDLKQFFYHNGAVMTTWEGLEREVREYFDETDHS